MSDIKLINSSLVVVIYDKQKQRGSCNKQTKYKGKSQLTYRPVSDFVTLQQQAAWSIMADVPRIRVNDPNLLNFGSVIEHTLQNLSCTYCLFIE